VQDIEDLGSKLEEHVSALSQRPNITFQVHDFFKPNTETSADVYFLRHIIHDWSDSYASKILQNIASVMKPSARIVVMDIVVPEKGVLPWHTDRMIRYVYLLSRLDGLYGRSFG
jgi:6-hydroxytryprostatin B O-methyltransferase